MKIHSINDAKVGNRYVSLQRVAGGHYILLVGSVKEVKGTSMGAKIRVANVQQKDVGYFDGWLTVDATKPMRTVSDVLVSPVLTYDEGLKVTQWCSPLTQFGIYADKYLLEEMQTANSVNADFVTLLPVVKQSLNDMWTV